MLDRFPTELISLVIDETATGNHLGTRPWQRKALLDKLSRVSKSYRFALRPLRESFVHVPKAVAIPLLRSWPTATRKAVITVLIGPKQWSNASEPFSLRDYSRLLSILPNIKHVYVQRVEESLYSKSLQEFVPQEMDFELNPSNPFRRCLSLSLIQSRWHFPPTLETASFKLRRLRLDSTLKGLSTRAWEGCSGLEQLLTTRSLPCLRELRLSCSRIPAMSTDFLDQLHAVQVDHVDLADNEHSLGKLWQTDPDSTPVLISFIMGRCFTDYGRQFPGITFARVVALEMWDLSAIIRMLPDLKALSFYWGPYITTAYRKSLDSSSFADTKNLFEKRSIELFAFGCNDDFVDRGFLDFLNSRGPRS